MKDAKPTAERVEVWGQASVQVAQSRFQASLVRDGMDDPHEHQWLQIRLNDDGTVDIFLERFQGIRNRKRRTLTYGEFFDVVEKAFFGDSKGAN